MSQVILQTSANKNQFQDDWQLQQNQLKNYAKFKDNAQSIVSFEVLESHFRQLKHVYNTNINQMYKVSKKFEKRPDIKNQIQINSQQSIQNLSQFMENQIKLYNEQYIPEMDKLAKNIKACAQQNKIVQRQDFEGIQHTLNKNREKIKSLKIKDWRYGRSLMDDTLPNILSLARLDSNLTTLNLNLSQCNVNTTKIKLLTMALGRLTSLKNLQLDLSQNRIDYTSSLYVSNSLINLEQLRDFSLNLSYNHVGNLGLQDLFWALSKLSNLQILSLDLAQNEITQEGFQVVSSEYKKFQNIKQFSLNLCTNHIWQQVTSPIATILGSLVKIEYLYLDLENNRVGLNGLPNIMDSLSNLKNVRQLYLNLSESVFQESSLEKVATTLEQLKKLRTLFLLLGKNRLGFQGVQQLAAVVNGNFNLTYFHLDLEATQIPKASIAHIEHSLAHNFVLQKIVVSGGYCHYNEYKKEKNRKLVLQRYVHDYLLFINKWFTNINLEFCNKPVVIDNLLKYF